MASWPSALPSSPLLEGYSQGAGKDSRIISDVSGARKIRNRYSVDVIPVSETYLLTKDQYDILRAFYKDVLNGGADTFTKYDQIEEQTLLYRFVDKPELEQIQYPYRRVKLNLEVLPQ